MNTKFRIYIAFALFLTLSVFSGQQAKAFNSENPDGQFATPGSNPVPVNYIFTGIVLGAAVVGLIVVRNAKVAINAKLKAQRQQGY
jgi:multisubunit Na+/H+ antiporter MnhC subunit